MSDKERVEILRAALSGVLGMARLEASQGSEAWRKSSTLIEEVLAQTKPEEKA